MLRRPASFAELRVPFLFLTDHSRIGAYPPNTWTPAILARGGVLVWVAANLVVTGLYFAFGLLVSHFFAAYGLFPAPIWLPTSIAVVAAMIGEARLFPGIFLGSFLANAVLFAPPLHVSILISITNALGPVMSAMVLRGLRPPKGLFTSFSGVVSFLVCTTLLSPTISATGGAVATAIGQPLDLASFYSIWVGWWLTDSGGTLYLAPALILWLGLEKESDAHARSVKRAFDRHDAIVWAAIAVGSLILFLMPPLRGSYIRSAFPFLLVVPLSWVALRMSLRAAYTLVTLVAIAAAAGTVAGVGPFQDHALANPLQLVGTLVVLLAMDVLTIVALMSERTDAEIASRNKSRFLADTSHELRTPLNVIFGASSLMEDRSLGSVPSKEYANYVRLIQQSSEYLLQLIDDLTQISKIEAGRFDLREEPVVLASVINAVADLIGVQARARAVALEADVPRGLTVRVDARALRQILLNLLSNAVKFTPEGGKIAIVVMVDSEGALAVRVSDTGVGIPADALERVFKPFERAHHDTERPIEGTGLGLSIARRLAALHGGTIVLESRIGTGTVATLVLPASRIIAGAAPTTAAQAPEGARLNP
jgi:two-component system, cell cycle sensor histidine kinase PleC